jgi:hypothetical protein
MCHQSKLEEQTILKIADGNLRTKVELVEVFQQLIK